MAIAAELIKGAPAWATVFKMMDGDGDQVTLEGGWFERELARVPLAEGISFVGEYLEWPAPVKLVQNADTNESYLVDPHGIDFATVAALRGYAETLLSVAAEWERLTAAHDG